LCPITLSEDGDPIDVLICNTRAIVPGAVINCRPIGVLQMQDDGGIGEKIIAVPSTHITQRYVNVASVSDLPDITRSQSKHFFEHYKDLDPAKWVNVAGWGDPDEAKGLIMAALERATVVHLGQRIQGARCFAVIRSERRVCSCSLIEASWDL
jgi:inorganic pyrophosphatase